VCDISFPIPTFSKCIFCIKMSLVQICSFFISRLFECSVYAFFIFEYVVILHQSHDSSPTSPPYSPSSPIYSPTSPSSSSERSFEHSLLPKLYANTAHSPRRVNCVSCIPNKLNSPSPGCAHASLTTICTHALHASTIDFFVLFIYYHFLYILYTT
jgi:hypothetical protein